MNFGKTILELRKNKGITQEDLAAELGVTAAAVSKWEHGYTLPDILMLCALADYFDVTTDELLGRCKNWKYAIIAAENMELGEAVRNLLKGHGFIAKDICTNYAAALAAAKADPSVTHLFASFEEPLREEERDETDGIISIDCKYTTTKQVLDSFEFYFENMAAINSLAQKRPAKE